MPRVVSANWFSENVSHLCDISYGRIASLLPLAPLYPITPPGRGVARYNLGGFGLEGGGLH